MQEENEHNKSLKVVPRCARHWTVATGAWLRHCMRRLQLPLSSTLGILAMKRINQHSEKAELNDIASFIPFLENHVEITDWLYSVDWCSGEGSSHIEESASSPKHESHLNFCKSYQGIYQTIDGEFKIQTKQGKLRLLAVDSSFWEVESDIPGIEEAFVAAYGEYVYKNA